METGLISSNLLQLIDAGDDVGLFTKINSAHADKLTIQILPGSLSAVFRNLFLFRLKPEW